MGELSRIEWTDHTFNPWIGCTKVSPGCANCYAERRSKRFPDQGQWGPGKPRKRTSAANWRKPRNWNKAAGLESEFCGEESLPPPRVFCASLADWLDPEVPAEWLADLLALITETPHLDWLLLTKRPELWRERLDEVIRFAHGSPDEPCNPCPTPLAGRWLDGVAPANVWVGTSVEDQARADERIPHLLKIPARVRFLSCEPLLGPVDLRKSLGGTRWIGGQRGCGGRHVGTGEPGCPRELHHHHDERCGTGIHWVISGGESGPAARPMHPAWARGLRDQCDEAGVPFFFKQWGAWAPVREDWQHFISDQSGEIVQAHCVMSTNRREVGRRTTWAVGGPDPDVPGRGFAWELRKVGKKAAGRLLDGVEHNGVPTEAGRQVAR